MARTSMANLINELRGLCEAGYDDYTLGTITYWTDDTLQAALDRYQIIFDYETMACFPQRSGSTYDYKIFLTGHKNFEGTPTVMDANGSAITSGFSFDWRGGEVVFNASQGGSARTYTGTVYDVNAAAADVWRKKASHYASAYDFSTDNHNMKRSQLLTQAQQMASYYAGLSNVGRVITIQRSGT